MKILVTGTAGFIGNHVALRLLERGDEVVGLDSVNAYYDPRLKESRLDRVRGHARFTESRIDLADRPAMAALFDTHRFDRVIHLAAQAGVRHSIDQPHTYIDSNISGFLNVLEGCRHQGIKRLVFASSSSVYGANTTLPFSEGARADTPLSLYAATKKANELMAHSYAHLYGMDCIGLRFFTVYGPWGRPDMALFRFVHAMLAGDPIELYNHGRMQRDFTYIDDAVEATLRLADLPDAGPSCRVYNIGNHAPATLGDLVDAIEHALGMAAARNLVGMQPGDVAATWADVSRLKRDTGFVPATPLHEGVARFVEWYRGYYGE